jgi:ABC-type multidrug transport system fused ATPase/permease subunit
MTYNQLFGLITALASAILVAMGAWRGISGGLTIGELYIFFGYIAALYGPVNSLTTAVGTAIVIGARGKRVIEIMDSEEVVPEKANATSVTNVQGAIEFRNVSFGYESPEGDKIEVLKDISFKVEPGQVVAIVGPTGTGKTSLISLLSRFYDPWQGKVLLDDVDISDLKLQSLREHISLVLQDPFIFPMSIAENIAFSNPHATPDEVKEVSRIAHCEEFIEKFEQKYETIVGERGVKLSGGQRQRIAIARAILADPKLLILDEATSSLDSESEAMIQDGLRSLRRG